MADTAVPPTGAARPEALPPTGAAQPDPGGPPIGPAQPDASASPGPVHPGATRPRRPRSRFAAWLKETVVIVVSALILSLLIKTFLVQAFFIPTGSMEDTLLVGDRVLVTKLAPGPLDLHRGDVVVFKDPGGWLAEQIVEPQSPWRSGLTAALTFVGLLPQDAGEHLIKRVVGLPGDSVECCTDQGLVSVNGVPLTEPYLGPGVVPSEMEFSVVVPEGWLWVMGDNRQNSRDSRYKQGDPGGGSIPEQNVVGVAFATVWPADRWSVLRNPGATFADVPETTGP